jgi:hypothetical protein
MKPLFDYFHSSSPAIFTIVFNHLPVLRETIDSITSCVHFFFITYNFNPLNAQKAAKIAVIDPTGVARPPVIKA